MKFKALHAEVIMAYCFLLLDFHILLSIVFENNASYSKHLPCLNYRLQLLKNVGQVLVVMHNMETLKLRGGTVIMSKRSYK